MGAVYGTLAVNFGKTFFSERFPQLWLFLIGALFIAVVMIFPNGLAGMHLRGLAAKLAQLRKRFFTGGGGSSNPAGPSGGRVAGPANLTAAGSGAVAMSTRQP